MSKKNSSVILNSGFKDYKDLSKVYLDFKNRILRIKKKLFLVAISGGPDSLALTALSKALEREKKIKFFYVLVDHKIRKNSFKEANAVKKLLKSHRIELKILSNQKEIKKNIQSNARLTRYNLLTEFCEKKKIKAILTAHNLEDQVETFFIRLSRGSGLTGLSAMSRISKLNNKVLLYRPLLDTKKKILIKISKNVFGKYFRDPSNYNIKYLRTRVRNLKKPLKESGINYEQIIKSINNLASSKVILEEYYKSISKNIIKIKSNMILINFERFKELNNEIQIRIINEAIKKLKKNYYNPRSKKVLNLINIISSSKFKKSTLAGCLFFLKEDYLCLKSEKS